MSWSLRSTGAGDAHHVAVELLREGKVMADCGLEFTPVALSAGRLALPTGPADPRQVCPLCLGALPARGSSGR